MIIDAVEAHTLEIGDFVIIEGEEVRITDIEDFGEWINVYFVDDDGFNDYREFDPFSTLEIWGN